MPNWWPEPAAGEIVWCRFPDGINPHPKPRPALILTVLDDDAPQFHVRVVYGTSQRTHRLYRGEFLLAKAKHSAAYQAAGLGYDTKFDFKQVIELPYSDEVFDVPPSAPHGQTPKLGVLHPSIVKNARAAYDAAQS